jgi:hypothetical protein
MVPKSICSEAFLAVSIYLTAISSLMCGHLSRSSSAQSFKVFDFNLSVRIPGTFYYLGVVSKFRTICIYTCKITEFLSC